MNETIETLVERRSIRKYKEDCIPKEILEEIIKAGMYAPTGMNKQSPIMLVITDKKVRNQLAKLNAKIMNREGIDPFYGAPVVLVVLADKNVPTYIYDGSLVLGNVMNAAASFGIGSCWIHRAKEEFETEEGKEILASLGIEGDYEGIGHCILGYPLETGTLHPRKENYVYFL